jgi:acetyltransferase
MSAARAAARNKPVLVIKAGRSPQGQAAAASHTGALAGSDLVFDAAVRRAGMLRVDTLDDLFVATETLARFRGLPSAVDAQWLERLTIVTNGGGAGVLAADAAALAGVDLAPMDDATRAALDAFLPPTWSRANPVDIIGDAPVERYVQTLRTLLAQRSSGTVLFMHSPTAIVPSSEIASALVPVVQAAPQRLLSSWLGDAAVRQARQTFNAAGIPCHDTPEGAVRAFEMLVTYRRNQEQLMQAPARQVVATAPDMNAVHHIVDAALFEGREWLTEPEAKDLLAACGVPVAGTRTVGLDPEDAVRAAQGIGYPVVLKVLSQQITHKSDVGGVALNVEDDDAVRGAVAAIQRRVALRLPDAAITGFSVQAMVRRPQALELIVGASIDPLFGPVLLFGQGGTAVEVVADRAVALPPLNEPLARALIQRTRVSRLLQGWRDVPPADLPAVVAALLAVSELLAAEPRIAEIDINPLLADAAGVIALDARVRVSASAPGGTRRFAILPYPAELSETLSWQGRSVTLRPIRPEDEAQHLAFLARLAPEDIRMRVFYSRRRIEHSELARLTQVDYEREMAFIATAINDEDQEETLGVARAIGDPDNRDAEFAIVVRSDLKGGGLGARLMHKLIDYQRAHGTQRMVGTILRENQRMLQLVNELGFVPEHQQPDPESRSVYLDLQAH